MDMGWVHPRVGLGEEKWTHVHLWVTVGDRLREIWNSPHDLPTTEQYPAGQTMESAGSAYVAVAAVQRLLAHSGGSRNYRRKGLGVKPREPTTYFENNYRKNRLMRPMH